MSTGVKAMANRSLSAPARQSGRLVVDRFRGVDLTNQPANVDPARSCNGANMVRDVPGKIRKRTGYEVIRRYTQRINGVFAFGDSLIVHAGTRLYLDAETPRQLFAGAADALSAALQLGDKLWFLDGSRLLGIGVFEPGGAVEARPADSFAYVPTITIGRGAAGGGRSFEPVNMLQRRRKDSFLCAAGQTVFQLSFKGIAADAVFAQKMQANGTWAELAEGAAFSVDRAAGTITFSQSPGAPPITGEDNLIVTYAMDNADYQRRVNGCRFGICYGVSGAPDRLFIAGNESYENLDFFSQLLDATYWGDIWYGELGKRQSPIMGYSIINEQLATHKRDDDNARNIILRRGALAQSGEPEFAISGVIQGAGAVSSHSFGFLKEPLFLCADGVCATTPYEWGAERYVQNRSFFINGALKAEPALAESYACVFDDFYMLACGERVYLLDTLAKSSGESLRSDFQYECYVWEGIGARVLAAAGGRLWFGDTSGRLCRFYADAAAQLSYLDGADPLSPGSGRAIEARWDIDFSGVGFYRKKWLGYLAVKMAAAPNTSIEIYCRVNGNWRRIMAPNFGVRFFQYSNLRYGGWIYSGDESPKSVGKRLRLRNIESARFSLRNARAAEPFGLHEIALEFLEGGHYRR